MQVKRNNALGRAKRLLLATAALVSAFGVAGPAMAEPNFDRGQNFSVTERARPDYDPTGIQLGAFILRPRLTAEVAQSSNVLFSERGDQSDTVATVSPELNVQSTWSRHSLRVNLGVNDRHYTDLKSERRTDKYINSELRLDVFTDTELAFGGSYANLGESRASTEISPDAAKPTDYDEANIYVRGSHTLNRVRLSGSLSERRLDFDPVALRSGGFDQSDFRDRKETTVSGRVEYAISPRTAVFGQVSREQRRYERRFPTAPANRDNDVDLAAVGVNFDIGSLARGEVLVGQFKQKFDDRSIRGTSGLGVDTRVEWFPQEITTVTGTISRRSEETIFGGVGSFTYSEAGLRVDHELQRNVLLFARVAGGQREFEGLSRDDDLTSAGAGVRYLVNREVEIVGGWTYDRQESSGANRDRNFDANSVSISLVLRR